MKKVLLIGDSIRQGYDKYVKMAFDGVAEVYFPEENCRFTPYILRDIVTWKSRFGLDETLECIHWNAGLWDDLVWYDGRPLVPLEYYKDYVERICVEIKRLFPNAKMIFATSTPVIEQRGYATARYNADTERYNEAASEIVKRHGGEINDLYSLMINMPSEYHSDPTHYYTKNGTRVLSEKTVASIEAAIGVKAKRLDYESLFDKKTDFVGY